MQAQKNGRHAAGGGMGESLAKFVNSGIIVFEMQVSGKSKMFCLRMTVIAASAMLLAGPFEAHARPDTRSMTCPQAKAFVKQNQAIVMTTGPNTYERIVIGQGLCSSTQITRQLVAPTVGERKCKVGYTCEEAPNTR
jgi:hypothetical protein